MISNKQENKHQRLGTPCAKPPRASQCDPILRWTHRVLSQRDLELSILVYENVTFLKGSMGLVQKYLHECLISIVNVGK